MRLQFTIPVLSVPAIASSLSDLCTTSHVKSLLPPNNTINGIEPILSTVNAAPVYNASIGGGMSDPTTSSSSANAPTYNYCNVTFNYVHTGTSNPIALTYALLDPASFKNRFYVAGGGGYSLSASATGGFSYGASGGFTNAGYDGSFDDYILKGNGTVNWDATYMFAYQALGEMTQMGKYITNGFYSSSNSTKLYTYFEGCSDGGRQGMSQVQRYPELYDGAIAGAPAFRFAQQQVLHVYSSAVEKTLDYYPNPCELKKIVNATIAACDPLDGRIDGVISRTDLCQLHFNLSSIVGQSYSCAGTSSTSLGFGFSGGGGPAKAKRQQGGAPGSQTSYQPAQNGTVSAKGVAVAQAIYDGLHNSKGQRAYLSWQIGSSLDDADTTYDNTTKSWKLNIPSTGGEYVTKFVQLQNLSNLANLDGATYETLVGWMETGYQRYLDSLQTTVPDLTAFQSKGGRLLHYHGESDPSVPAASSVHYWQSVRSIMYPETSSSNVSSMSDWYQLYLVPGAAHCGVNSLQPGPYPQDNMQTMIDWVENGKKPSRLNATISSGTHKGETQLLCQWPTRPLWHGNSSSVDCVNDSASIKSWTYSFPAFKVPIY